MKEEKKGRIACHIMQCMMYGKSECFNAGSAFHRTLARNTLPKAHPLYCLEREEEILKCLVLALG